MMYLDQMTYLPDDILAKEIAPLWGAALKRGFFNPSPIRRKWAEHLSGQNNWQYFFVGDFHVSELVGKAK